MLSPRFALIAIVPVAIALPLAVPALANEFQDLAAIDRAVEAFTGAATGAPGGARLPVDRRLRLHRCGAGLALERYGANRSTVLVRCPDAGGWRIFVPLDAAPAAAEQPLVQRGEMVAVTVRGTGFSLTRKGEALDSGGQGEWIRVRLSGAGNRREPVRARVLQPGRVGMDLP